LRNACWNFPVAIGPENRKQVLWMLLSASGGSRVDKCDLPKAWISIEMVHDGLNFSGNGYWTCFGAEYLSDSLLLFNRLYATFSLIVIGCSHRLQEDDVLLPLQPKWCRSPKSVGIVPQKFLYDHSNQLSL
jgi:hypothetical protein